MLKLNNLSGGGKPPAGGAPPVETSALYVWGHNNRGQLGLGDETNRLTITANNAVSVAIFLSETSHDARTILFSNQTNIKGAGRNDLGQIGDGTTVDRDEFVSNILAVSDATYIELERDYSVYSSGASGRLTSTTSSDIGLFFTDLSGGWTERLDSWSWQDPQNGQDIVSGDMAMITRPAVGRSGGAVGVFAYGLEPDGNRPVEDFYGVLFWPLEETSNRVAQLLTSTTIEANGPVKLVTIGSDQTFLILNGLGELRSFVNASSVYGEAGGNIPIRTVAEDVLWKSDQTGTVTDIAGNRFNSFAIIDGAIWACGSWQTGCVGTATSNVREPIQLGSATNWVEVQAGFSSMLAKNSNNELWFIGNNQWGQLGDGSSGQIVTELTRIDSSNTYDSYLVTRGSVYANRVTP